MDNKTVRLVVGALIAGALLVLYGWVLVEAIQFVRQKSAPLPTETRPTETAFWVLHSVGGLVSALVAAQLAVTQPSGNAGRTTLFVLGGVPAERAPAIIALIYLVIWLALGLAAVIFGLIEPVRPDRALPELVDFAKTWIGLAIAAAYAYFGIRPPGN